MGFVTEPRTYNKRKKKKTMGVCLLDKKER